MNSEPVVIEDDDDVVVGDPGADDVDDDVKIIEQKPASPIVIDDEPQTNEAEEGFVYNLRNNTIMSKIVDTCMNMENTVGIQRVLQKTLIPLYRDTDPKLKESRMLTKVLKNTHKLLLRDPDYKFLHLKNLCEQLKSGRLRKKVPFVTLATTLRDNDKPSDLSDAETNSNEQREEPNRNNTAPDVEKTIEIEIQELPRLRKRKQNNTIIEKSQPKRRYYGKRDRKRNIHNKKTDVIVLDNSDDESGNSDEGNIQNKTNQEATASTESNGCQRKSHNSSTGEDSNKENNGSKTVQVKETNIQPDKTHTTYCYVPIYTVPILPMNINSEQNPQLPMNSTAMQNPLPMNSSPMQNSQLPMNSTPIQNSQLPMNCIVMQNPLPMNSTLMQNPRMPMNSTLMQNSQLPTNSTAMTTPQLPMNSTAMTTPQLPMNSTLMQNPRMPMNNSPMQTSQLPVNSTLMQNPRLPMNSTAMQNPRLPINSTLIQNPQLPINCIPKHDSFLDPRLFTNLMPIIHNQVSQNDKISETVAVIEYNAAQDVNNVRSEDGMDIEVFIPQTHIENQCKVSDDAINAKETCSNNQIVFNQSYGSIVNNIVEKALVPKKPIDNRMLRDLLLCVNPMYPTNCKVNEIAQCHLGAKNPKKTETVQDNLGPKNPRENEIVEDLLIPKNHIEAVIQDDVSYGKVHPDVAAHERYIAYYKKELAILEEKEVTTDHHLHSPYLKCARLKEKILDHYKKICKIIGSSAQIVKRCEIRLNVAQGHHPGPAKRLEKFLNSTIGEDGLIKFPDFHDVMNCVFKSNDEDDLGWNNTEIFKEASALFYQCGQALRKRRQQREYKDLMGLVRDKELADDDPADKDPLLLAKLEQNKRIAKHNETEILNRYVAMENMKYSGNGGNNTVEFQSDEDSSSDSGDEDREDKSPRNQIKSIQSTQDNTSHAEDKINLSCTQPSLLGIFLEGETLEPTDNNESVTNASPSENSALLNSSSECCPVNSNITQGATGENLTDNIESSPQNNVENSTINIVKTESLATNVTDEEVVSKDSDNCEKENIIQGTTDVNNIKQENESIKINFSESIDSVTFMTNCNNSSASTSTHVKIETTIKPERLDIQTMFNNWSDNFECTVFDIEDPFLVIEISSDEDSDDDL